MSFAAYAVLWVALVVAAGLLAVIRGRPRFTWAMILALPAAVFILWLLARPASATTAWAFAGRQWAIDEPAWQLTGITLLLLLAAVAHFALHRRNGDEQQPVWLFALAAAALPVVWAADAWTRVLGLGLLALVWAASIAFDRSRGPDDLGRRLIPALPFAPALFSLWLAGVLPTAALPFSLLAAVLLFCVQPPGNLTASEKTALDLLRGGLPLVAGAAVLLAALRGVVPSGAAVAAATALGLLGLVIGLWRAWYQWPERLPQALGLALCGLLLTAAVWAGPAALLPAARLAVFAPALLVVANALRPSEGTVTRVRWAITPQAIAVAAVLLAVAGLPLTVGSGVLAPLYEAWLASGGWVLLAVTVILLTIWLATLFGVARLLINDGAPAGRIGWLRGLAQLPLLAGLVHFNTAALGLGVVVWVAIGPVSYTHLDVYKRQGMERG